MQRDLNDEMWQAIARTSISYELDAVQHDALTSAVRGNSMVIMGDAGTGKTRLNRAIQNAFTDIGIVFTPMSSTNMAARLVEGKSIHRALKIPVVEHNNYPHPEVFAAEIENNADALYSWLAPSVWIFDEFSMIHCKMITFMEQVARIVRKTPDLPWGGLQVIFIGDVMQLPPVDHRREKTILRDGNLFPFESPSWKLTKFHMVVLLKLYRQGNDLTYAALLRCIRVGLVNETVLRHIRSRMVSIPQDPACRPIRLVCKKRELVLNEEQSLQSLPGSIHSFDLNVRTVGTWTGSESERMKFIKSCKSGKYSTFPAVLKLKIGARVRCLVTRGNAIVNGSCGVVTDFMKVTNIPVVKFDCGVLAPVSFDEKTISKNKGRKTLGSAVLRQIPLVLAYSGTVHAFQGQTLQSAEMVLGEAFAHGQVYTALSRVTNMENVFITSFPSDLKVDPRALQFTLDCKRQFESQPLSKEAQDHYRCCVKPKFG